MRRAGLCGSLSLALLLASAAHAQGGAPLDLTDATPRNVFVQIEQSSNLGTVGETFGPAFPAAWSANGNTGTLTISAATHEEIRTAGTSFTAVPGSFTAMVFELDLTTLQATSAAASGAMTSGQLGFAFTQQMLTTMATVGYASGGNAPAPLFCTSQAQVEQWCQIVPQLCGATCNLVPGHAYDPSTGEINLVGRETQQGCDGGMCQGPFDLFTQRGDLRLSESAEVPALPGLAPLALCGFLAASARSQRASERYGRR
jgi:hypothetical protein